MKLPGWLRERIHEWMTPGGCWISNKLVKKLHERAPVTRSGKLGLYGAAAMALATQAAKEEAVSAKVEVRGLESRGEKKGSWLITIQRLDEEEVVEEQGVVSAEMHG